MILWIYANHIKDQLTWLLVDACVTWSRFNTDGCSRDLLFSNTIKFKIINYYKFYLSEQFLSSYWCSLCTVQKAFSPASCGLLGRSSRPKLFCEKAEHCNFIKKETPAQLFSCELCKSFKNTSFFQKHLSWLLLTQI